MRTVSKGRIRTADGSNSMKPDGCGRRTHPLRPPQGRIRTADAQTFFPGGRKRTADAPHSSASRTDSDGGQAKFLRKRTEADAGRRRTKSVPRALVPSFDLIKIADGFIETCYTALFSFYWVRNESYCMVDTVWYNLP